ncbi:hypothetical protein pEaSNUABM21_00248 [Erwinia phage pEa_SNUABM_21]|nr:hypothetical protein pEaSNUABM21_00248 [Erwinia phage pEa_SNUABM_21]
MTDIRSKTAYEYLHDTYLENNFFVGVPRSKLTAKFQEYLKTTNGKLHRHGLPLADFMTWANMRPEIKKGEQQFDAVMRLHKLSFDAAAVYTQFVWSFTKGVFKIDQEIWKHLAEGEPPKILPSDTLKRLPNWSQWLDTSLRMVRHDSASDTLFALTTEGFWSTYLCYDHQNRTHMFLVAPTVMQIGKESFIATTLVMFDITKDHEMEDNMDWQITATSTDGQTSVRFTKEHETYGKIFDGLVSAWIDSAVNALLFVASSVDNVYKGGVKGIIPRKQGKTFKVLPIRDVRVWHVGSELLNEIRQYESDVASESSQNRRAHIRRGHYHNYWYGPRDGERVLKAKWLPPCVVRGTAE